MVMLVLFAGLAADGVVDANAIAPGESVDDVTTDTVTEPGTEATPEEGAIVLEGEALAFAASTFKAKCALCHGEEGEGTGEAATNLVDEVWQHGGTLEEIAQTISEGVEKTLMRPQKDKYTPEQIADLVKYIKLLAQEKHAEDAPSALGTATELTDEVAGKLPAAPNVPVVARRNFIDEHIFGKMEADGIPHAGLASDVEFMRRVYLDLWGRIPTAEAIRRFVSDGAPDKRDLLIDRLLGLDAPRIRRAALDLKEKNPDWNPEAIAKELLARGYREEAEDPDALDSLMRTVGGIFREIDGKEEVREGQRYWLVEMPFLSKWTFFFEDLFRNGLNGEGSNQKPFREYLWNNLKFNVPYDYMVRELLTASATRGRSNAATGFLARHGTLRNVGAVYPNHEDICDEIAVYATRNFLGVNLQCISCHDGADHLEEVNLWLSRRTREEFWRQAAFFGRTYVFKPTVHTSLNHEFAVLDAASMPRRDAAGIVGYDFAATASNPDDCGYALDAETELRMPRDPNAKVYPEYIMTDQRPAAGANPRAEFARMITSDLQFARTTVNLIWSKFMTVGIVDPPFGFDPARLDPDNPPPAPWTIQPSHPRLLDALASDFIEHGYDLRHLMRTICRSNAYQLTARFAGEYKPEYDRYYARKLVRRLSAEEIYDSMAKATNVFGHQVKAYPDWNGYAMDLPSPLNGLCDEPLREFLFFLGRGDRGTKEPDTNMSVIQSSLMVYSDLLKKKVRGDTEESRVNTLLKGHPPWKWGEEGGKKLREMIDELFLWTLSRFPTATEKAKAEKHLKEHRDIGIEDLQWALLNKSEMIVNY